ncbi:MAG TPA: hypothetical protein VGF55_14525, partial [Gemmataceae bacterium]
RTLDRLGDAALDALREAARAGDTETRRRAAELVERITRRQAAARAIAPAFVSLNYDKTPLADAVADLSRRTGTPITLHGDAAKLQGRTVTLVAEKVTAWQAVQLVCNRADLHEWDGHGSLPAAVAVAGDLPGAGEGVQIVGQLLVRRGQVSALTIQSPASRVALVDGTGPALPVHLAGAVRVRALPPGVPFLAEVGKDRLVVLNVAAEPRLHVDGACDLRIDRAVDDRGRSLPARPVWTDPPDERDDWPRGVRVPPQVTDRKRGPVGVRLPRDETAAKRLRELAGVATVHVFVPEQVVDLPRPAGAVGRTVRGGGVALTLVSLSRPAPEEVRVAVEVQLPYGSRLDLPVSGPVGVGRFGRPWGGLSDETEVTAATGGEYQGLALEDAAGRRFAVAAGSAEIAGLFEKWYTVRLTATFRPPAAGAEPGRLAFAVRRPTAVDVPFVLRDVPLP